MMIHRIEIFGKKKKKLKSPKKPDTTNVSCYKRDMDGKNPEMTTRQRDLNPSTLPLLREDLTETFDP